MSEPPISADPQTAGLHPQSSHAAGSGRRRVGRLPKLHKPKPGTVAGIDAAQLEQMTVEQPPAQPCCLTVIDYCPQQYQIEENVAAQRLLAEHRPGWSKVRWINVDGLADLQLIQAIASKYELHPLAVEDVLHVPQRPKVDHFPGSDGGSPPRLFIVARMVQLLEGHIRGEQVSLFLGRNTVITFQEDRGDVWNPIREQITRSGSRLRINDASFLLYALLDAIVDHSFPILDHYSDLLEDLELIILERFDPEALRAIHRVKRELLLLRRQVVPMREMLHTLGTEHFSNLSEVTQTYLRDVFDHALVIIDMLDTYRDIALGLTEAYMAAAGNRLNQVMKVLTVISTIFIPLTFLAGVYGMNFHYLPELDVWWAYPAFWGVCIAIAAGMYAWFRRRGWL